MNISGDFEKLYSKVWTRCLSRHSDSRGYFLEYFRQSKLVNFDTDFIQDSVSVSQKNVLRGLHVQENQWQLSTILHGKVQYFVLDVDVQSKEYLKLHKIKLYSGGTTQILAAPGVAHGFLAESADVVMSYKNSTYYDSALQHGINFASFNEAKNLVRDCVRSERDTDFMELEELLKDNAFTEFQSRIHFGN